MKHRCLRAAEDFGKMDMPLDVLDSGKSKTASVDETMAYAMNHASHWMLSILPVVVDDCNYFIFISALGSWE